MNELKVLRFAEDGIALIANSKNNQVKPLLDDFSAYAYESEFERIMYFSATDLYAEKKLTTSDLQLLVNSWHGQTYIKCNIGADLCETLVSDSGVVLILTEQVINDQIWLDHLFADNIVELDLALAKIEQVAQLEKNTIQSFILRFLTESDKQQFLTSLDSNE
ncbi:hypothetical protein [Acinetobacter wuhouensis]|uniref:Uncharacterized protein n=1 Tax=Acinetobacter wuhouensis TaxID=1879050 RepID=A0A4Q7ALA9_9GAMM|nr:hypothetical protein [Acinetobacter wuhouensis]RZG48015.1 hypothetical protein EXU28_04400 [Acinetobacter wuhouensis]RZG75540.1 hypothetical protein EXU29_01390 [Acinetobacter wuhouensis]